MRKKIISILDHLMNTLNEAIFLKDGEGKWLYVNEQGIALFGLEEIAWQGKNDQELSELKPLFKNEFLKCAKDDRLAWEIGTTIHFEEHVITPNGDEYIFDVQKVPLFYPNGEREALYTIGRNITAQRQAQRDLKENEARYSALKDEQNRMLKKEQSFLRFFINSIGVSVYGIDQQGICTFINPAGIKTLGYQNAAEIIGKSMHELIHHSYPDGTYLPKSECKLHIDHHKGESIHSENETFWRKNHTPINVEYWSQPMIENGHLTGAVTTFVDVTERLIARSQLIESEKRFREMFDQAPLPYQSLDSNGVILDVNHAWLNHFGYERHDVIGHSYQEFITPESLSNLYKNFPNLVAYGAVNNVEFDIVCKNHSIRHVELEGRTSLDSHGNFKHTHCILSDVTEKTRYINDLKLSARIIQGAAEGILITDAERTVLSVNPAFTFLTGYLPSDVIGGKPSILNSGKHDREFYTTMNTILADGQIWQGEIWNRKKSGEIYAEFLSINPVFDDEKNIINYVGIFADITQQKSTEEKLHYLAHHDLLTTLPNRVVLYENLTDAIAVAHRENKNAALLMLDLDRFKEVNDNFGHSSGDELLQVISAELRSRLRSTDTIARLGGDEFAILLRHLSNYQDAADIAQSLIDTISQPRILSSGHEVYVGLSIGIAIAPEHGSSTEELMQHADTALYNAKALSKGSFRFYTDEMTEQSRQRLELETRLRRAIANGELYLVYQPQVNINTGEIKSVEALLRWNDPLFGTIAPATFIPIAEETGMIREIGKWVLEQGCAQAKAWLDQGIELRVAINLSSRQFEEGILHELVFKTLEDYSLPAHLLELELTESILLHNERKIIEQLNALKSAGITLSLDDFGTGYSSLSYLKQLPFDILKIDKSFIDGIPDESEDMQIASSIIAMGHILGFKILAEGVETHEQVIFLQAKGCDIYQGYFRSRPTDPFEITEMIIHLT